jgi:hypothetical protein
MSKSATDIATRALTLLDEQLTEFDTPTVSASTEMSMKDMALEVLPEVCRSLVKALPYELKRYLSKSGTPSAESLSLGEDQSDYVKKKVAFLAPEDFWELVAIQLSVWSNPQTTYILIDDPKYSIQNNPFTRSGKQNPTVVITNTLATSQEASLTTTFARIECFSVHNDETATISLFEYISFDNVPNDTDNEWPDELFDVTTKALAAELMLIKQRTQQGSLIGNEGEKGLNQHKSN